MSDIMKSVSVLNLELLEILNEFKNLWQDNVELLEKSMHLSCNDAEREDYISKEYCNKIINNTSIY